MIPEITERLEIECSGQNTVGNQYKSVSIEIIDPWVTPSYREVESGASVRFTCNSGQNITWFDQNSNLIQENERYSIENGTLQISKIFASEKGTYTCRGENGQEATSNVFVKPFSAQFTQTPISMAKIVVPSSWYEGMD